MIVLSVALGRVDQRNTSEIICKALESGKECCWIDLSFNKRPEGRRSSLDIIAQREAHCSRCEHDGVALDSIEV